MAIRVEHSTVVGARARQVQRISNGMQAPDKAHVTRPQRFDKNNKPVKFNNSDGHSDEVAGAWYAVEFDTPLTGYERHAVQFVDDGLCDFDDVL